MYRDVRTRIPVVEVIAPDGRKSLWIAAVAMAQAVEAVKQVIPPNYVATLTKQRLTITRRSVVLRRGEVRRIALGFPVMALPPDERRDRAKVNEAVRELESWRELQLQNIEFTMKRLREPTESRDGWRQLATGPGT